MIVFLNIIRILVKTCRHRRDDSEVHLYTNSLLIITTLSLYTNSLLIITMPSLYISLYVYLLFVRCNCGCKNKKCFRLLFRVSQMSYELGSRMISHFVQRNISITCILKNNQLTLITCCQIEKLV